MGAGYGKPGKVPGKPDANPNPYLCCQQFGHHGKQCPELIRALKAKKAAGDKLQAPPAPTTQVASMYVGAAADLISHQGT